MKCPDCSGELTAVGGVPTIWQCNPCTKEKALKNQSRATVRFEGDTMKTLRRV